MDDRYSPRLGMFSCLPCWALYRWARGFDDPECQPLFPPPSTILTPPKRRPNLPNLSSSSSSSERLANNAIWSSAPVSPAKSTGAFRADLERVGSSSRLSEEGRERMGSISRAYGGRMQFLQPTTSTPSTPSIPSTPVGPGSSSGLGHLRPLSSLRPLTTSSTPTGHHQSTGQVPPPYRPSVPNLGRSASEPRDLADLGGFAPHQVPFGVLTVGRGRASASVSVGRGGRGRNRSATINESQRFSSLSVDVSSEGKARGRSPGPASGLMDSAMALDGSAREARAAGEDLEGEQSERQPQANMGRSMSHPTLYGGPDNSDNNIRRSNSETASEISITGHNSLGDADFDQEEDPSGSIVVHRELGLRGLGGLSGRARGGKGRTKSRGSRSGSGSASASASGSTRAKLTRPVNKGGKRITTE
ncbi:hypothetical protein IAU59_000706 [Kwoniella sp. CBS 9459]